MFSADLFANAVVSGLLLGGFYAAVALGLAIVFGQLDIVNIAHPAFIIVGAYVAYILNSKFGLDPVLVGIGAAPLFFVVGALFYRIYFLAFERTGQESLSGLAFFFGVMPVLTEAASHYGITADEMARASITGQPLHTSSPLVASFLLLVGLAKVELGDHMRKAIWRASVVGLVMLAVGVLTTAYPF